MKSTATTGIESDFRRLETGIRQLKVQYDQFFAGALTHEPFELRRDIEALIQRYSRASIRSYAHQFQFNALVSRFNCMSELWSRRVRTLEEGDRRPPVPAQVGGVKDKLLARCRMRDPLLDQDGLRRLHSRYLAAQRSGSTKVPFEKFLRNVASHADRLRKKSGCDQIELRLLVRDDQVRLIARPGR